MSAEREISLLDRAYRRLARRDYSRAEMRRYLERYCDDAAEVATVIADLEARGSLSETRVAQMLVRKRAERGSASRVRQELARRGISAETIAEATGGLESEDLQVAMSLWRKRFGLPAATREEHEKQVRFLINRGFGYSIALKVVRSAGAQESVDGEA